jgi:hypothetical protein
VPRTKLPEALAKVAEIAKKYEFEHENMNLSTVMCFMPAMGIYTR